MIDPRGESMIRLRRFALTMLVFGALAVGGAAAGADPDVVVFYREGCHDCGHMDRVLEEFTSVYPELIVVHIEEAKPGASDLMWSLAGEYGIFPTNYPVIFVGDEAIVGIGRDKELLLRSEVQRCILNGCPSPLSRVGPTPIPWMTILVLLAAALSVVFLLLA
jgi:hypothetical protein